MSPATPTTGPGAKGGKKLPQPLLPPVEEEKAPPPVLTRQQKIKKAIKTKTGKIPVKSPFATPAIAADIVNEQIEVARANRIFRRITWLSVVLAVFCSLLAFSAPFFKPLYVFHSITPEGKTAILVPLDMPNLTNPAVVSWAANSVTEIMSFGFGDI